MADGVMNTTTSRQKTGGTLPRLDLKDIPATRRTIARLIRRYAAGNVNDVLYKGVLYGLQSYLAWFRLEKDLAIEQRLEDLEARLPK